MQPWQAEPAEYDVAITRLPLYAHLDTERHVNNVSVLEFHLEARLQLMMKGLGADSWHSDGVRLRPLRTVTQFVEQVHYGAPVTAAARLVEIGQSVFRILSAVFQNGRCAGVQDCLMGAWVGSGWVELPNAVKTALSAVLHPVAGLEALEQERGTFPSSWPCRWPLVSRYADLDSDRHLGELALYRYVEQARARPIYTLIEGGLGVVIARLDTAFYRWDAMEADPGVDSGIHRVGNTSLGLAALTSTAGTPLVTAEAVIVLLDRETGRPTSVTPALRERLQPMLFASI